jgi:stearoyl-CoA desaturase (delta-9 desaturase)
LHINILLGIPLFALYGVLTTELQTKTLVLATVSYFLTGFGITGGYHRLWSHRCWNAIAPVRFLVLMFGAAALQGSARWWCRNHRAHHKFTDTTKDPYNVRAGFLYAHFGWMMFKQDPKEVGFANIDDLNADWMIMFQHKYYGPIALFTSIALPTMIAGLGWGDWRGGYFYASLCRIVFVHHATFFVNSLAHYLGDQAYSDLHTAFDSMITALLTLGEGYHNYHHEFPQDFRNGIRWYQYDPTKWTIMALHYLGLAYDLRFIPDNEVAKARLQVKKGRLTAKRNELAFGKDLKENLPELSARDLQLMVDAGKHWIIIENRVYDVTDFLDLHPGGRDTLLMHAGNDVSSIFRGETGLHIHSSAAEAMLPRYIVGKPGPDVTWGQND